MCLRMGWRRPSQLLKSPTRLTRGGVGGPNGEVDPLDVVDRANLRAQPVVALPVPPLVQQVQVVVGQQVRKGVRIVHRNLPAPFVGEAEDIAGLRVLLRRRTNRLEQAGRMNPPHRPRRVGVERIDHPSLRRLRQERPHRQRPTTRLGHLVRAQQREGVFVPSFNELPNAFQRHGRSHAFLLADTFH